MEEMTKEVNSAPQKIRATINGKKLPTSQELLGLPEPNGGVNFEANESRV